MEAAECLLITEILLYSLVAPYTKVEESFNLQACYDILNHGISPTAIQSYDHTVFPGVVPRTFVGSLLVSLLAYVPSKTASFLAVTNLGDVQQAIVRAILGLSSASTLIFLARVIGRRYDRVSKNFFLALQGTQFHVIYYASRSLPNTFGLMLSTIAFANILDDNIYVAIALLTFSTVVFRVELLIMIAVIVSHGVFSGKLNLWYTIRIGLFTGIASFLFSFAIDSYFWGYLVVPEFCGFMFNAVAGNSSAWGISPWYQYVLDLLKLQLNPMAAIVLVPLAILVDSRARYFTMVSVCFIGIYSFQPHKEWRFIVYVAPLFAYIAAIGAAWIFKRRGKGLIFQVCASATLASIPCAGLISLMMLLISTFNYPGGVAMTLMPKDNPGYLDVLTCMTGSSKFLQADGIFSRTENQTVLSDLQHWDSLAYASLANPDVIFSVYNEKGLTCPWTPRDTVYGYAGIDRRAWKVRKEAKIYIMENSAFNA